MKTKKPTSRRQFLWQSGSGLLAVPVTLGLRARVAMAGELVDPSGPTAAALSYVEDAATSDKRTDTAAICGTCQLFTGEEGSESGPCALFPGKDVKTAGWCTAWVLKSG